MVGSVVLPGSEDGAFAGAMPCCEGLGTRPGHRPLADIAVALASTL